MTHNIHPPAASRRAFLANLGLVSVSSLIHADPLTGGTPYNAAAGSPDNATAVSTTGAANGSQSRQRLKKILFWDLSKLDYWDNLELAQGQPVFQPQATYIDPTPTGSGINAPVVYEHQPGVWRMFYSIAYSPHILMLAESEDGRNWKPCPVFDHPSSEQAPGQSAGQTRIAAHHLLTVESGSASGVYIDPIAHDGCRFKLFARQRGTPVYQEALARPDHRWHEIASREGQKRYFHHALTYVSKDGVHWQLQDDYDWGLPDWHPEPPIFGFFDAARRRHCMTVRPGWGDRRVCLRSTDDFRQWTDPELIFQPDALDDQAPIGMYGMPVFPYDETYVGLLWIFHNSSSRPVQSYNQFFGTMDAQLAFSYDAVHFFRGKREPFLPRTASPHFGCSQLRPSSMVQTDREIRIYSEASKAPHGLERQQLRETQSPTKAATLHTLRRDGLMYLRPRGDWARLQTRPLAIWTPQLIVNAEATFGEVQLQITNEKSEPVQGFSFDDCIALRLEDNLSWQPQFKNASLAELVGKVIRIECRFRNANLYSIRCAFHCLDAQDQWMLYDQKTIDTTMFDF